MAQNLSIEDKQRIQSELVAYVQGYPSQNKAAASLKGTSAGTVNSILNGKWENISDDMWMKIRAQVHRSADDQWQIGATAAFRDMETFLDDAQREHNVSWIAAPAGIGKTTTAVCYANAHRNVFLLPCSEDMHKSDFIDELAKKIGIRTEGLTVRATLLKITDSLVKMKNPLLIFDEGDKLTDSVMYYFISLYNALEGKCGIVFLSTQYIERRMMRGLRLDKKGYEELYSRIGRKFVGLSRISDHEVNAICRGNGLSDEAAIGKVLAESRDTRKMGVEYDLRRVRKSVHKHLRIASMSTL